MAVLLWPKRCKYNPHYHWRSHINSYFQCYILYLWNSALTSTVSNGSFIFFQPTHVHLSGNFLFFFLSNHWNRWQCWDARRMPRNSFCSRHLALQKYRHIFHRPGPDHWSCAIFILGMICMVKSHGHNSSRHFIQHISIRRTRAASDGSCRSYLRRLSPTTIHCWLCAFQHFHRICSCFCFFSILDDLVWF